MGKRPKHSALCDRCGIATTHLADDGTPRHVGCDIAGHQVTLDEAIAALVTAGIIDDPDVW